MMKLILVDDHVLFREGLAAIIRSEPDIEIAGLAGSVQEAIELARRVKPDVILMDHGMPDGTGVDATRAILSDHPQCKIVFLTVSEQDIDLIAAVRSGAKGYLLKNMRPAKLIQALRSVQNGESALSRSMTLRVMEELSHTKETEKPSNMLIDKMTTRELEVLNELVTGKNNLEIANRLFISENTVKYHVHSILEKLGMPDRKAAAAYAIQYGLV